MHSLSNYILGAPPDLFGVVLYPSWLRIDLPVLFLSNGHNPARTLKDNEASTGRALVDCSDVTGHLAASPAYFMQQSSVGPGQPK